MSIDQETVGNYIPIAREVHAAQRLMDPEVRTVQSDKQVLITGVLAVMIIGIAGALAVMGRPIPDAITLALGAVIGAYFASRPSDDRAIEDTRERVRELEGRIGRRRPAPRAD